MTVTPQTNCTLRQMASRFAALDNFVICGHVSPDGDCLSSQLALAHALRRCGKQVACVLVKDEPIEANLARVLPGSEELVFAGAFKGPVEVFIGVDVPTRERIGEDACRLLDSARASFTIDHHAVPQRMCDTSYTDPDAASTTMLVWELIGHMGIERSGAIATCCYTGLVTDTGRFQFQNTDARSMKLAAEMVEAGADPASVSREVFQNRTVASLHLEGVALQRMSFDDAGLSVISYLTRADFERFGAVKSDAEPLVNVIRSVAGVRVACMLREQEDCIRGSIRAKDDTNVAAIAEGLGGGGHIAAAGFTLHCSMDEALSQVKGAIAKAVAAS